MSLSDKDILLIEKYLDGSLQSADEKTFSEKLRESKNFAEEVYLQETMLEALKKEESTKLRELLKKEARNIVVPDQATPNFRRYYLFAAVIALLVISTIVIVPSRKSLFKAYYEPLVEVPITRSESSDFDKYRAAMKSYSEEDYSRAIELFQTIIDVENKAVASLYLGNCFLATRESRNAIIQFQSARLSESGEVVEIASWFLALAYVQEGEKEKASSLLSKISNDGGIYSGKAADLNDDLTWTFY